MTIKELMNELKKYPQETEITIDYINEATDFGGRDFEEERDIQKIVYFNWSDAPELHLRTY